MSHDFPSYHLSLKLPSVESVSNSREYRVLVANEQATLAVDEKRLANVAQMVLADSNHLAADVSIAVVDDPTIHALNVQFLKHDYPTDVLSFVLEDLPHKLEGELVVSADTAIREAAEARWSPLDELLLYVIHGALHLVGYLDKTPADKKAMYAAELRYLERAGIVVPLGNSRWSSVLGKELSS